MEIGTRQQMNAVIGGTLGAGFAAAGLVPELAPRGAAWRVTGAIVAGGLASGLVAGMVTPDTAEEPSGGAKLAAFGGSIAAGGAVGAATAGAMGLRGAALGLATFGGAATGLMSAMMALSTGPMSA